MRLRRAAVAAAAAAAAAARRAGAPRLSGGFATSSPAGVATSNFPSHPSQLSAEWLTQALAAAGRIAPGARVRRVTLRPAVASVCARVLLFTPFSSHMALCAAVPLSLPRAMSAPSRRRRSAPPSAWPACCRASRCAYRSAPARRRRPSPPSPSSRPQTRRRGARVGRQSRRGALRVLTPVMHACSATQAAEMAERLGSFRRECGFYDALAARGASHAASAPPSASPLPAPAVWFSRHERSTARACLLFEDLGAVWMPGDQVAGASPQLASAVVADAAALHAAFWGDARLERWNADGWLPRLDGPLVAGFDAVIFADAWPRWKERFPEAAAAMPCAAVDALDASRDAFPCAAARILGRCAPRVRRMRTSVTADAECLHVRCCRTCCARAGSVLRRARCCTATCASTTCCGGTRRPPRAARRPLRPRPRQRLRPRWRRDTLTWATAPRGAARSTSHIFCPCRSTRRRGGALRGLTRVAPVQG